MTKRQSIFRASHSKKNPYFQMLRTTAQNSTLSFEARGVIAYLLSQDEKWEINKSDLMKRGCIGTTKMNRIVSELIELKYLTRTQENVKGKFEKVIYTLYEEPQVENATPVLSPEPLSRKPLTEKPQAENARQDTIKGKEDKPEEKDLTGAKSAPDADAVETCSVCGSPDAPFWVGYAYRCEDHKRTARTPPKPKRKRSEKQLALDGMKNALADAFELAHDKVTGTKWNEFGTAGKELLLVGATPDEMKPLHAWCVAKGWDDFSSMAMSKEYAKFDKARTQHAPRRTEPPLTDEIRMANVHELMTPFPTGGDE